MSDWYPSDKAQLNNMLDGFLSSKPKLKINQKEIHGIIVPHAGYVYSGAIAGKAFALLKNRKFSKAVIFGPSHYKAFMGIAALETPENTPLGKVNLTKNSLPKIPYEHSIENQIPFIQKLNPDIEILPIAVGHITLEEAESIAERFLNEYKDSVFIFSTDLSHFLRYDEAVRKDKTTIDIITTLNESKLNHIDACGIYPLLILFEMCKIRSWKPRLIEYKNSGDVTGDKISVVGYSSFVF
jgi:AmmeMemoRadiSam system protein B